VSSAVTDSSLCSFGGQFRLIFIENKTSAFGTTVPTFELVASNPGQFYYNIFLTGNAGTSFTETITIPYPFVTQGSQPIQAFDSFTTSNGCFVPGNSVTGSFTITAPGPSSPSGAPTVVIGNYSPQAMGSTVTITVTGNIPATGHLYVNVHLNYGLKGVPNFAKDTSNNAINATTFAVIIPQGATYTFSATANGQSDSQPVTSTNRFNKDPGVAGVVTDLLGNPRANVLVQLYDSSGSLVGMSFTDNDGVFAFAVNLSNNKPTTFTVTITLPSGASYSQSFTLRKNKPAAILFAV